MTTVEPDGTVDDVALLERVVRAARAGGDRLLTSFSVRSRPAGKAAMYTIGRTIEEACLDVLRPALAQARPAARWTTDDLETTALPPGEWWSVDPVEGGVNFAHGLPDWCVSITLLRDNIPVLTVVHEPVADRMYTAVRGAGAHLNGSALHVSAKTELEGAVVATSQGRFTPASLRQATASVTAMLERALMVRMTVPSTFPILAVAAGQVDAYWQFDCDLPGVAAGILLVTEAGGVATDLRGDPWKPGDHEVLITTPALHAAALAALAATD